MDSNQAYFHKAELNDIYSKQGYVIVPLLDSNDLSRLVGIYNVLGGNNKEGFYASLFENNYHLKQRIDLEIRAVIEEKCLSVLKDIKPVVASYVVKFPGDTGKVFPHQDWTFVDEKFYNSFNIWLPLQDVGHNNGALYLFPGSHKLPFTFRGTNIISALVGAPNIPFSSMQCINMKAGEALIYDHRMIHASPPNKSMQPRYGVAMVTIPRAADLIHVARLNGVVGKYKIDREFFYKQMCIDERDMQLPDGYSSFEKIAYSDQPFSEKALFPRDNLVKKIFRKITA